MLNSALLVSYHALNRADTDTERARERERERARETLTHRERAERERERERESERESETDTQRERERERESERDTDTQRESGARARARESALGQKKSLKGSAMLLSWQHCASPFLQLWVGPRIKQKILAAFLRITKICPVKNEFALLTC